MATKLKFKWSVWAYKVLETSLAVLVVGGASVLADNPLFLVLLPLLKAIQNYLKHH